MVDKACVASACKGRGEAFRLLGLGLCLVSLPRLVEAVDELPRAVAVLYPDIGEPYRSVFSAMMAGIEESSRLRVFPVAIRPDTLAQDVSNELRYRDIRSVIALGRNGMKMAAELDKALNIVAAGVLSVPESLAQSFAVYSLAPDPVLLFGRLRAFMPAVRRVLVVHDPRQNAWLMRLARDAARSLGIELLAVEADDLRGAVRAYQELLTSADARRDAVWLPQDSTTVDDAVVVPMLLRETWNQNILVFSSSLAHVKRGALFALYPDNVELGRSLSGVVTGAAAMQSGTGRGIQPLRDVQLAVNTRTASHLGIKLAGVPLRFNLAYPEP